MNRFTVKNSTVVEIFDVFGFPPAAPNSVCLGVIGRRHPRKPFTKKCHTPSAARELAQSLNYIT